jgi:hypothetical protein
MLFQFVIESADTIHHIEDYSGEPLSAKVLQIKVLSAKAEVLILTENSVSCNHFIAASWAMSTLSRNLVQHRSKDWLVTFRECLKLFVSRESLHLPLYCVFICRTLRKIH